MLNTLKIRKAYNLFFWSMPHRQEKNVSYLCLAKKKKNENEDFHSAGEIYPHHLVRKPRVKTAPPHALAQPAQLPSAGLLSLLLIGWPIGSINKVWILWWCLRATGWDLCVRAWAIFSESAGPWPLVIVRLHPRYSISIFPWTTAGHFRTHHLVSSIWSEW